MSRGKAPWNKLWSPAEIRRAINQEMQLVARLGDIHLANKARAGETHDIRACVFCQGLGSEMKGMERIARRFGGRS